jgi:hypothetical protein
MQECFDISGHSLLMWLPDALPPRELRGQRIVHDLQRRVEAHCLPAGRIVFWPAAVAAGSKSDPSRVHRSRERWRGIWAERGLSLKERLRVMRSIGSRRRDVS